MTDDATTLDANDPDEDNDDPDDQDVAGEPDTDAPIPDVKTDEANE